MAKPLSSAVKRQRLLTGFMGRSHVANFAAAFRRTLAGALASQTMPSKALRAALLIVSTGAAKGASIARGPPARDAEREGLRRCVLSVVRISDIARRAGRPPPVRPGKAFCAMAMRMSAGNSASLTSLDRHSFGDAIAHPASTTIMRSAKIVL